MTPCGVPVELLHRHTAEERERNKTAKGRQWNKQPQSSPTKVKLTDADLKQAVALTVQLLGLKKVHGIVLICVNWTLNKLLFSVNLHNTVGIYGDLQVTWPINGLLRKIRKL